MSVKLTKEQIAHALNTMRTAVLDGKSNEGWIKFSRLERPDLTSDEFWVEAWFQSGEPGPSGTYVGLKDLGLYAPPEERIVIRKRELWKVISVDNFDREGPGRDELLIHNGLLEKTARDITACHNHNQSNHADRIYRAVPHSYVLRVFQP